MRATMGPMNAKACARDVMSPPATVTPDLPVERLAALMLDRGIDGVCVVQEDALVGVVTAMDLIFEERSPRMPSFIAILDAVIPLRDPRDVERELRKLAGVTARDAMTEDVVSVTPDTPIAELAALMYDHHLTVVPVVEGGRLVGVVDKPGMLRAAFGLRDAT